MAGIKWLSSFETGIKTIDDDHRAMVDTISNIHKSIKDGDLNAFRGMFDVFLEQAEGHFRREEALLTSIDFPHVESHAASHNHLLDLVGKTIEEMKGVTDISAVSGHLEDMTFYLLEDVIKADAEFKSFAVEVNAR